MRSRKNILVDAKPFKVILESAHENLKKYGDVVEGNFSANVQKGVWQGPGRYFLLRYSQPCPRGCCNDNVNEVLTEEEYKDELAYELDKISKELKELLKDQGY